MSEMTTIAVLIVGLAAGELVALVALVFGLRRVRRREQQLEQLWERHRRAVERDVAYLHDWQDFLGSFAGDLSEDERG